MGMKELKCGREVGRGKSRWQVKRTIAAGAFGQVYVVAAVPPPKDAATPANLGPTEAAMKVEIKSGVEESLLVLEVKVARLFSGQSHAPTFLGSGTDVAGVESFYWMAMELLGPSLSELRKKCGKTLSASTGLRLFHQGVEALSQFHSSAGFVHRDIKPANLAMGLGGRAHTLILLDFGLARRHLNEDGSVRPPREDCPFRGSIRYASARAHEQKECGRADDLWSLLYVFIDLLKPGNLCWIGEQGMSLVGRLKTNAPPSQLANGLPQALQDVPIHLSSLDYASQPDYHLLQSAIQKSLDAVGARPDDEFDWEYKHSILSTITRSISKSVTTARSHAYMKKHTSSKASNR